MDGGRAGVMPPDTFPECMAGRVAADPLKTPRQVTVRQ